MTERTRADMCHVEKIAPVEIHQQMLKIYGDQIMNLKIEER